MYTGIFSDTEGWNVTHSSKTREEIIVWFVENGIDVNSPDCEWNPSPMIICGDDHRIEQFDGFQY